MTLLIGMDEAGYGPNLGPLVVSATAWEVPGDPRSANLWENFAGIVEQTAPFNDSHIQIADSKQVYTPARGFGNLEAGVLNAVKVCRAAAVGNDQSDSSCERIGDVRGFRELLGRIAIRPPDDFDAEPWYAGVDLPLAVSQSTLAETWLGRCRAHGIRLMAIRSDVVLTKRFNDHTRLLDSKGQVLTEISMNLVRHLWQETGADDCEAVLIIADKHGGRNRYHEFLPIVFGDRFIRCHNESTAQSRYSVGNAEIRFETKSERHLPVALASMVSKYLRELAMILFNRFWTDRQPGLKSTAGYPVDALRFKADIAAVQSQLGIGDEILWRER